jgi:site-specific recombinase XerD
MKYPHIDQHFIDHLPTPTDKIKAEYRADNFPTGFRIEIRNTSKGIGTYRFRTKHKDHNLGRTSNTSLEQALEHAALISAHSSLPNTPLSPPIEQISTPHALTLNAFWQAHFSPYAKARLRTYQNYEIMWRKRIKSVFGQLNMSAITTHMLTQFQTQLMTEGLSGSHVTGHLKMISRMYNLAIQWEMLTKNPCDKVEYIRFDNQQERFLSKEEQARFVKVLMEHPERSVNLLILFLLVTGVRSGVAKGLKWSWINFAANTITVPASIAKNKKQNVILLNTSALDILDRLKDNQSEYVFINPRTQRPYCDFKKTFKTILKTAQINDKVRPHDLRHTFCSNLVSNNVSLATVQQLANHACYSTTLRYAKISPETLQQACQVASIEL